MNDRSKIMKDSKTKLSAIVVYQGRFPETVVTNAGATRASCLVKGLNAAGIATQLISPSHFGGVLGMADCPARQIGPSSPHPTARTRLQFWSAVVQHAVHNRIDRVIFYNTTLDSLHPMRMLNRSGVYVALELCDMFSTIKTGFIRRSIYRMAEKYLPRQTSLNIAISTGIQRHLLRVAPETRSCVIPGLFDFDAASVEPSDRSDLRRSLSIPQDCVLFTYCGSWLKIKGLETLLMAWKQLRRELPVARLVITGSFDGSPLSFDARSYSHANNLADSVFFPGFLSSTDLYKLLDTADVVLCPHGRHKFAEFAFPTKVAEYAGLGKPIIASDLGDIHLYLEDNKSVFLCEPDNVSAFKNAMFKLAVDPLKRKVMGDNASAAARDFFDFRRNGKRLAYELMTASSVKKVEA